MTPATDEGTVRVTLRLPEDVHSWLSERSTDEEVSLNSLIVESLADARGREGLNRVLASQVTTPAGEAPAFRLDEIPNQAPLAYRAVVDGVVLGYLDITSVANHLTEYERVALGYRGNGIYPLMLTVANRFSILVETYDELWRWCWFLAQAVATAQGHVNHVVSKGTYTGPTAVLQAYPPPLPESEYGIAGRTHLAVLQFNMPMFQWDRGDEPEGQVSSEDRIVHMLTEMTRVAMSWGCIGRVSFNSIHSVGGDQLPRSITHYQAGSTEADYGALGHAEVDLGAPTLDKATREESTDDPDQRQTQEISAAHLGETLKGFQGEPETYCRHDGQVWRIKQVSPFGHAQIAGSRRTTVWSIHLIAEDDEEPVCHRTIYRTDYETLTVITGTLPNDETLFESDGSDAPSKEMVASLAGQTADTISYDGPDAAPEEGRVKMMTSYSDGPGLVAKTPDELDDLAEQALDTGIDLRTLPDDHESRQPGEVRLMENGDPSIQTTDRKAMRTGSESYVHPEDSRPK